MSKGTAGFSLVEMAIVLAIIALLMAGLLPTLSSQIEQQRTAETRKQLDEIQQALIGYAITYGRLPCPAADTSNGVEDPSDGSGVCSHLYDGFLPAATLGISTIEDNKGNKGFAVDSWGNRIRYAVTSSNSNAFTKTDGMRNAGISSLSPDLLVCASSAAISGTSCGPSSNALTSSPGVPVVIFSTGKNGSQGAASTDESANLDGTNANGNRTFVSHTPTGSPEFDDLVVWISPNILINRMVAAGKLP